MIAGGAEAGHESLAVAHQGLRLVAELLQKLRNGRGHGIVAGDDQNARGEFGNRGRPGIHGEDGDRRGDGSVGGVDDSRTAALEPRHRRILENPNALAQDDAAQAADELAGMQCGRGRIVDAGEKGRRAAASGNLGPCLSPGRDERRSSPVCR